MRLLGSRPSGAIVDAQLLEVGQDGEGHLCAPAVAAQLIGRAGVGVDIDTAFLGLGVKLGQGADAESVIRGFLLPFDLQTVFGNNFAVLQRGHGRVAHVPAQGFEKRIDQTLADMGFLDAKGKEIITVVGKVFAKLGDFLSSLIEGFAHIRLSYTYLIKEYLSRIEKDQIYILRLVFVHRLC